MPLSLQSTATLHHGVHIPLIGLGVYQAPQGAVTQQAVKTALALGYRHVDTAKVYGNEADVGKAIRDSGLPRSDVFVTTKLWNADHGYDKAIRACHESLKRLGSDHVDLYLIHWPVANLRHESWRALVTLQKEGTCRAIGVSNYTVRHLKELLDTSPVVPAVNQVELSPFLYQKELLDFCSAHGIVVEAYSPLTKGERLSDRRLTAIAARYRKSAAQILIRWCLQHDTVVLPKSVTRERIRENADVFDFEISPGDMAALDGLNEDFRTSWDPTDAP
jgi:diketogulonate reductase-like aldo/keto reductase